MPVVSIIVPVYNSEKYLERCVESLINQTLQDLEILLVDDGSKDSSPCLCDELARKDRRIKVIHIKNGGVSNARNVGIRASEGEYLSFVDSDDWVEGNAYELLYIKAQETGADVLLCDYTEIYADNTIPCNSFMIGSSKAQTIRNMIGFGPRGGNIWNFILTRRSMVVEKDLYFPIAFKRGEDFWYTLHTYVSADHISKVEANLYMYDLSNVSSSTHNERLVKDSAYLFFLDDCISFLNTNGVWEDYKKEMNWRILLEKTVWAIHPSCFKCFLSIHPESNEYIDSNPFLGNKMKLLMKQLSAKNVLFAALMAWSFRIKAMLSRR